MWSNLIGAPLAAATEEAQDGWEDDDDLVEDSETTNDEDFHEARQEQHPDNNGGGMRKMFVGRLTRFLEQVTHPDDLEEDNMEQEEDVDDGWQDDEVVFDDEDKKVEDYHAANASMMMTMPDADEDHNAWDDDNLLLDTADGGDDEEFPTMQESINRAEAALDQALEDIHQQEAGYASGSDAGDLNEDASQERQAILEIQREMEAVSEPPVVDVTPASGHTPNNRWTRSAATSIVTQWATEDGTRDSGPVGTSDDEDIFQDENEDSFGPVVDQVPRKAIPMVRTDSLAAQAHQDPEEEEEVLDETIISQEEGGHEGQQRTSVSIKDEKSAVVDQTPSVARSRKSHGESVDAILSLAGESTLVNEEDEDSPEGYGLVVDQIPENANNDAPKSGSIMPVVADDLSQEFKTDDAMDETVFGKGDASTIDENTVNAWEEDDVDVDDVDAEEEKSDDKSTDDGLEEVNESADTTKISSVLQESTNSDERQQGNLVDYTPYEDGDTPGTADPSVVVLAADEDLTRDTGEPTDDEVFGEENELDFAPVVDHTPSETNSRHTSAAVSLRVEAAALEEDFRQDDAMDETCFGDSTVDPNNTGDEAQDGWEDEDLKVPAIPNPNLVDQTPSQLETSPPKNTDPSVAVLASIDESADEEDSEYGLMVDQTPRTPALPAASRSDSIVVQAADVETVEDESIDDDDGDTFTDELPLGIGNIRSADDILVDRVPPRPESRFGDASTMVAAEPSEIMSEVDDMMAQEEEQNFGPIVDATPPNQAVVGRPSATGSTVAFAPNSVASDDLEEDDGDETEGNDAWNNTILEEATPNPQSGNDEPVQQEEQLVDFLPEEDASSHSPEDVSVTGRTASSSVAIGGAQSLLQPEDPKEDDFGPVVDQTPTPLSNIAASAASIVTHVTASEMRSLEKEDNIESRSVDFDLEDGKSKVVVDYIPHFREKRTMDSLATVGRSQLTEEEEEEETASKFGPVVDHLPTPRTSLAPSRGGSTVDALATVSEANSVGEGDGWEDDLDLEDASAESDRTDRISTLGSVRRAQSTTSDHDRSVSVRFDSSVRSATLKPPPVHSPRALPGTSQNSSTTDGWDDDDVVTDIADASSIATGEASRLFDHSLANAETPPSTPYSRPVEANITDLSLLQPSLKECPSCANSKSMECPCVQKLLRVTRGAGSLTGTLLTAEGDSLEVDFGEMLREEIAKRRLLEEEAEALRTLTATQQHASETLAANETSLQSDITNLRKENESLLQKIEELKSEGSHLRENSKNLSNDLKRSQTLVDELHKTKLELIQRENARLAEIDGLKKLVAEKSDKLSAEEDLASSLVSVEQKLLEKDSECQQLQARVSGLQDSLEKADENTKEQANKMESQISLYQEKLSHAEDELTKAQDDLSEKNHTLEQTKKDTEMHTFALQNEIDRLNESKQTADKQIADLHSQHQSEMQRQYDLLDARTKDIKAIEAKLKASEDTNKELSTELQKQKTANSASAILAGKLAAMTKERDTLQQSLTESQDTVNSLQSLVDEQGMKREALDFSRENELTKLRADVKTLQDKIRSNERQVEDLNEQLRNAENEKEAALTDTEAAQSSVWDMQEQIDTTNALLADAEARADSLEEKLRDIKAREQQGQRQLEKSDSEKKHLESRLIGIEKKLEMVTADANRQAARASELESKVTGTREEMQRVRHEKDSVTSQMQAMDERSRKLQSQMSLQLQEQQTRAENAVRERETEIRRLQQELDAMSQQSNGQKGLELELQDAREWIGLLQKEKDALSEENDELLVQLGLSKSQMDESGTTVDSLRREMDAILFAVDAVNNGGDYNADASEASEATRSVVDTLFSLQTKYADLEAEMTSYTSDRERGLEHRINDLVRQSQAKEEEINLLREQVSSAASSDNERVEDLTRKIESLEHACREKDQVIQAKTFQLTQTGSRLTSLEQELHFARSSSSDASAAAHELRMATNRAERAESALEHSQAELGQTKTLVKELESELSAHEESLREMQAAQESSRRFASADAASWQRHAQGLEEEVTRKSDRIAELERRIESLEQSRMSATQQLAPSGEMDALREQVDSLAASLESAREKMSNKDKEMAALTAQIRDMDEKQQHTSPLEDFGGDDVESLRSQIVALATALEKSETRRAEAIEKLTKERNTNAETMRRLGEQVRHFCTDMKNIT